MFFQTLHAPDAFPEGSGWTADGFSHVLSWSERSTAPVSAGGDKVGCRRSETRKRVIGGFRGKCDLPHLSPHVRSGPYSVPAGRERERPDPLPESQMVAVCGQQAGFVVGGYEAGSYAIGEFGDGTCSSARSSVGAEGLP